MIDETATDLLPTQPKVSTAARKPVLLIAHHPDASRIGERVGLPRRQPLLLGRYAPPFQRGPLADRFMSTSHARVHLAGKRLVVEDAGSRNGVYVRGERIGEAELAEGDLFQVGQTFLQFRVEPRFPRSWEGSSLVGISLAMHQVREGVERAGRHQQPVLVLGDTGTGKEPTAREVHRASGRRGAFVAINCSALPKDLVESELFGHTAGAFSGARGASPGLFRAAQRGTLFLDELATMPPSVQPKLLRAMQERRVRPVGSTTELAVDARIVAATNRDPTALVAEGGFRGDLYARLLGGVIRTPALADRPEDVAALALHFLAEAGYGDVSLSSELLWELFTHPWPLNVRALRQFILTAAADIEDGALALTEHGRSLLAEQRRLHTAEQVAVAGPESKGRRQGAKRQRPPTPELEAMLTRHAGRIADVARELGVHRYQVYRWIEASGLDVESYR